MGQSKTIITIEIKTLPNLKIYNSRGWEYIHNQLIYIYIYINVSIDVHTQTKQISFLPRLAG